MKGCLWWCNSDQEVLDFQPYTETPNERELGMLRQDLSPKPVMLEMRDFQGTSVVNYTEAEVPYTRIHEFKHYHPEDAAVMNAAKTIVTREYPAEWRPGDEPYYPIDGAESQSLLERYRGETAKIPNLVVGGRLGGYKYYDMDKSVEAALAVELP